MMPLSNDAAGDRRGVRKGRSKAAARARRRASAPYLEGLESRALLSTVQGLGPEGSPLPPPRGRSTTPATSWSGTRPRPVRWSGPGRAAGPRPS